MINPVDVSIASIALLLTTAITFIAISLLVGKVAALYSLIRLNYVVIQLRPLAGSRSSKDDVNNFFAVIHGLINKRSMFGPKVHVSFEVTSSRRNGIIYSVRIPEFLNESFRRALYAYYPELEITQVNDPVRSIADLSKARILSYRQGLNYSMPLASYDDTKSDPMNYIVGSLTSLNDGDAAGLQILLNATGSQRPARITRIIKLTSRLMFLPLFFAIDLVKLGLGGSRRSFKPKSSTNTLQVEAAATKLSQPLFRTEIRAFIQSTEKRKIKSVTSNLDSAMKLYSTPNQKLISKKNIFPFISRYIRRAQYIMRLPAMLKPSNILSAHEIAALYHLPHYSSNEVENIDMHLSQSLASPISMKSDEKFDVVIGRNSHHGNSTPIGLSPAQRQHHVYVVGGTGAGKSTLMKYALIQDINAGKGAALVDPHGDLAETILRYIPKERMNDVVYFNPDDLDYPVGLNLLELRPGLKGTELQRERDMVTEMVVSIFRKVFSEDGSGGHRVEYVLRNTIQTALRVKGATIFTVLDLLNDPKYRTKIIAQLKNKTLKDFWTNELGRAGAFQRIKMTAGITAKVGRFEHSVAAKRIMGQTQSTIDLNEIMTSGKILICNVSKGLLGEDTSRILGMTILGKIQMACLGRARLNEKARNPFYLYVDEFQNFATISFTEMLSEARKFRLYLTMAEQTVSQQSEKRLTEIILANTGTVVCFRTGSAMDEKFLGPLYYPYVRQGGLLSLPLHKFFVHTISTESQEPTSGYTIVPDNDGSPSIARQVARMSRDSFTVPYVAN